jgi:hypothetical protein
MGTTPSIEPLRSTDVFQRIAWVAAVCAVLGAGIWGLARSDWYALGDAVPPVTTEPFDADTAHLDQLLLNANEARETEIVLPGGAEVEVRAVVTLDVDQWFWNAMGRGKSLAQSQKYAQQHQHLPRADFLLEFQCRASGRTGVRTAVTTGGSLRRHGKTQAIWTGTFQAPERPGGYRLRVVLRERSLGQPRSQAAVEHVLGHFPVTVRPKAKSAK